MLDGPDGAGKSTQVALLAARLKGRNIPVLTLREPGGTAAGEVIRKILLETKAHLSPLTEAFLFQAARAQLVHEVVEPALRKGTWVVCDRFTLSTLVYQGIAGGVEPRVVGELSAIATGGLRPDVYFVIWVSPKIGIERRAARAADRMESKGSAFIKKVSAAFSREGRRKRYHLIDGKGSVEEIAAKIWKRLARLKAK